MSRSLSGVALLMLAGSVLSVFAAGVSAEQKQPVRHIVIFKYKPGTTPEQIKQVTDAFRDLRNKIPGITGFEDGVNNSPEKLNRDFTHIYMLTFEDVAARDAYLPHPDHKKFGDLLGKLGVVAEVFVVDYTQGK